MLVAVSLVGMLSQVTDSKGGEMSPVLTEKKGALGGTFLVTEQRTGALWLSWKPTSLWTPFSMAT